MEALGSTTPATQVGQKAAGLFELPEVWTPPFVVLSVDDVRHAAEMEAAGNAGVLGFLADGRVNKLLHSMKQQLIVRSSAVAEDMTARGSMHSEVCAAEIGALCAAVRIAITANRAMPGEPNFGALGLIVQTHVSSTLHGHASNERRISRRHDSWLIEITGHGDTLISHHRVTDKPSRLAERRPTAFVCTAESALLDALRTLTASTSLLPPGRRHLEWVWDGHRVWIVQNDLESPVSGTEPGNEWTRPPVDPPGPLSALVPAQQAVGDWQKARCVRVFAQLELATSELWVLEDDAMLGDLAADVVPPSLRSDLEELCRAPVIVRTDRLRGASSSGDVLLPRTETCLQVAQVIDFMQKTSRHFAQNGLGSDEFCFLIHRFIPAQAGTYSIARPNVAKVRVDSTWGVPDGLLYLPHDSFEVDLHDIDTTWSKIRCKYAYVDIRNDGSWFERSTGSPWDWKVSLERDDLQTVARQASLIADHVGAPVEVMHFVGVTPSNDLPTCLPWFFRETDASARVVERAPYFSRNRVTIRTPAELGQLTAALAENQGAATSIALSASCEFLRDRELVDEVAKLADRYRLPIDLEGSALAHVFYMLRSSGARVRAYEYADPPAPAPRTFDKLVRDDIPRMIEGGGERVIAFQASGTELQQLLRQKVVEESLELFAAATRAEILAEAADVLEVVTALCGAFEISDGEVHQLADVKRASRGGFSEGVVLKSTFVPSALPRRDEDVLFESDMPQFAQRTKGSRAGRRSLHASQIARVNRVPSRAGSAGSVTVMTIPTGGGILRVRNDGIYVEIEIVPTGAQEVDGQLGLFDRAAPPE